MDPATSSAPAFYDFLAPMYYSFPQAVKQEAIASPTSRYSPSPVRNKRGLRVPEGTLCEICSDVATGHHYDAVACNGCKTFFRRTITSGHTYVCQYTGNCDVNKDVRNGCRHCRFNKCIAAGMNAA
ncbi:Nuclear hormone receptor family member nhr-1, partial [Aphelenchoides avenae]